MASADAGRDGAAVVVLPLAALGTDVCLEIALELGALGAAVVVVGTDRELGEVTHRLRAQGVRAAAFVGSLRSSAERSALVEMVGELFESRPAS